MFFRENFTKNFDITNNENLELDGSFIPIPIDLRDGTPLENVVGTQFRVNDVSGRALGLPEVRNGALRLRLDTFNPSASNAGDSYFGSSVQTKDTFNLENGPIAFEASVRVVDTNQNPLSRGLIYAFFSFTDNLIPRDEIDFELLGNFIDDQQGLSQENSIFTNVFDDDDLSERGDFEIVDLDRFSTLSNLDLTGYNTFRIEWFKDQILWIVNDIPVRIETETIPDEEINIFLNIWANGFPEAFDTALMPATNLNSNQTFFYDVDYLLVEPNLSINGTNASDTLRGDSQSNVIRGLGGHDRIRGLGSRDTLDGGSGHDTLLGEDGRDLLNGGVGMDSIVGGTGSDTLNGELGNDYIVGGNADDVLRGHEGNDTLNGGNQRDSIFGGEGRDRILGQNGSDNLKGDNSNDSIFGGEGNDTLFGGSQNDRLNGNNGNDSLLGNSGNDLILGGNGFDSIIGGGGNDILLGEGGNDTILGQQGSDILAGGAGNDRLTGGTTAGVDRFQFSGPRSMIGLDNITDFDENDILQLSRSTFGLGGAIGSLISSSSFAIVTTIASAGSSRARITYIQSSGSLFLNQNGVSNGFGAGGKFADLNNNWLFRNSRGAPPYLVWAVIQTVHNHQYQESIVERYA